MQGTAIFFLLLLMINDSSVFFCHSLSFDFPHTVQIEKRKSELLFFDKVVKSLTAVGKVWFYFDRAITFH